MYCSKCGKQIADDSAFCAGCGTAIGSNDSNPDYYKAQGQKARVLANLLPVQEYFGKNAASYDRFFSLSERYDRTQVRYPKIGIILPIIFGVIAGLFILPIMPILLSGNGFITDETRPAIIFGLAFLVFGVGLPIFLSIKKKRRRAAAKQELHNQLEQAYQQLIDYYNDYPDCPISFDYSCPTQLNYIVGLILDGRADTLKEAINTMEADQRNDRIEMVQHQLLAKIQENIDATNRIFWYT